MGLGIRHLLLFVVLRAPNANVVGRSGAASARSMHHLQSRTLAAYAARLRSQAAAQARRWSRTSWGSHHELAWTPRTCARASQFRLVVGFGLEVVQRHLVLVDHVPHH